MRWNFCPICGHRVYQHGSRGCTVLETHLMEGEPPREEVCSCGVMFHDIEAMRDNGFRVPQKRYTPTDSKPRC